MGLRIIEPHHMVFTQSNKLATAAYAMSLLEKRLVLLVASAIRKEDAYMKRYSFSAIEVIRFLGLQNNKNGHRELRRITSNLLSRVIDLDMDGDGDYEQFQWMASARYISKKKSLTGFAQLELQVHSQMCPFLLDLKERFSSVPFGDIAQLPSFYSMRMFEILWAESHQLRRKRIRLSLIDLKRMLKVETTYPNFFDFKRRVLHKAQQDLESKTPLSFTFEVETQGNNKVVALVFTIIPNNKVVQLSLNLPPQLQVTELPPITEIKETKEQESQEKAINRLIKLGVSKAKAMEFIAVYGPDYIDQNLDVVEARQKQGKVQNILAFTYKALAKDYRKKEEEGDKSSAKQSSLDVQKLQEKKLEEQYDQECFETVAAIKKDIPAEILWEDFVLHMDDLVPSNQIIAKKWRLIANESQSRQRVEADPLLRSCFRSFILNTYSFPYLRSFETWQAAKKETSSPNSESIS